jgi:hypothetical protein
MIAARTGRGEARDTNPYRLIDQFVVARGPGRKENCGVSKTLVTSAGQIGNHSRTDALHQGAISRLATVLVKPVYSRG